MQRVVVWVVGVLMAALLVLGTIDPLVWMPLHLAPTTPLDRIDVALVTGGLLLLALGAVIGVVALATRRGPRPLPA